MKKKQVRSIIFLVIMCMLYSVVYAESMELIYDGKSHQYNYDPIVLYIDDKKIETTVMPPIQFDGAVVVPAREVFSTTGATVEWRPSEQSVYVHNDSDLIVLKINSNEAWVNGETKYLNMPAKLINDKVMIPIRFISEALGFTVNWSQTERVIRINTLQNEVSVNQPNDKSDSDINNEIISDEQNNINNETTSDNTVSNGDSSGAETSEHKKVVVIDAGHGDHDSGTAYEGLLEKDLTLSISQAVVAKLRSNSEVTVYATREDDSFLQLMERAEFANAINPDLFISIHINSVDNNAAASGTETYYTEKTDTRNKVFATMIQKALVEEFGTRDRGVKTNSFVVTKYTNAPAILIEIGFITNEGDREMMTASDFTSRYAEVVYQCIMDYYAAGYHL